MSDETKRTRLETEALVLGYAMSRLDTGYLENRKVKTWQQAYREASLALSKPPATFDNLRDEFDPIHPNQRQGWRNRPMRPTRERVVSELSEVSDEALSEMVARILQRDEEAVVEAIDALALTTKIPANVAERLLTGRRAEDYFLENSLCLVNAPPAEIVDLRLSAGGFDFGIRNHPEIAVEVKGLKLKSGGILFTDREWREARQRRQNYLLIVVGNLAAEPVAQVIPDPHSALVANCTLQTSVTAVWRSSVSL